MPAGGDGGGAGGRDGDFDDFRVERDFPGIGPAAMVLNGRRLGGAGAAKQLILLAIEDVTDRRRAERAAELRHRTWFELALGSIGDAVVATDGQGRVTFLNPAAEAMTGWPHAEAAGRPLADVFHIVNEDTRRRVESPVAQALRLGAIVGLANHTLLIARDGTERGDRRQRRPDPRRGRGGRRGRDGVPRHHRPAGGRGGRGQLRGPLPPAVRGGPRRDPDPGRRPATRSPT